MAVSSTVMTGDINNETPDCKTDKMNRAKVIKQFSCSTQPGMKF